MSDQYGLLGWPVAHSLSPKMHEAAFRHLKINANYHLLATPADQLEEKIIELKKKYCGFNITIPYKGTILPFLDEIDPIAKDAKSVNTVVNYKNKLVGYSTDGYGLEKAILESFRTTVAHNKFFFWGTGGAARACCVHFAYQKAKTIFLANRTKERAVSLAQTLQKIAPGSSIFVISMEDTKELKKAFAQVNVVFQCTSLGLHKDDPISIPSQLFFPKLKIMDMIYHPTLLLKQGKEKGCEVAGGQNMLLFQGAKSFSLWTQKSAPVAIMRKALCGK